MSNESDNFAPLERVGKKHICLKMPVVVLFGRIIRLPIALFVLCDFIYFYVALKAE